MFLFKDYESYRNFKVQNVILFSYLTSGLEILKKNLTPRLSDWTQEFHFIGIL